MAKHQKTKRTQIKDLAVAAQELSGEAMEQVQGGTTNLSPSTSKALLIPSANTVVTASEKKGLNAVNVKLA